MESVASAIAAELDIACVDPRLFSSCKFFEGYVNDVRAIGAIALLALASIAALAVFRQSPESTPRSVQLQHIANAMTTHKTESMDERSHTSRTQRIIEGGVLSGIGSIMSDK